MSSKRRKFVRRQVCERDQNRCRYCGILCYKNDEDNREYNKRPDLLTMDHVIPVRRGGRFMLSNLVVACNRCNNNKGDRTLVAAGMVLLPEPEPLTLASRPVETYSAEDLETPYPELWGPVR